MRYAILAALLIATGVQGYRMGVSAEATRAALKLAEAQREAIQAAERATDAEAARLAMQAERDLLAQSLEDAAHADPDASVLALGADSVRRLNRR